MEVTVIVPTYNGVNKLPGVLKALSQQSCRNFELLIVVDGSTDGTVAMLRNSKPDLSFRIIEQSNKGRAAVRNRGVKEAKGDLIIFYDDDMVPAPDSIQRHIAFHLANKNALLTGYTPQFVDPKASDFIQYRAYISNRWTSIYPGGISKMNADNFFLTAQNCSLHKYVFLSLSGFDERLTDGEDKDLAKRAHTNGFSLYYDKQNVAIHNEMPTCKAYIKRLREYALAERKIFVNKGRVHSSVKVSALKKILYSMIAFAFFVRTIDSFNFFLVFPRKVRYKIYDAITFSLSEVYPSVKI